MSNPQEEPPPNRGKRERSTRYPGVSLPESIKLCESIAQLGLDGLTAADIASALGYTNIKTNTFSARLSGARQFGLLRLAGTRYELTPLARAILHPVDTAELPRLYREALVNPPLYAELAERLSERRVPEAEILGNVLYHNHQIIASAKRAAAESFLESARFAGALGDDQVFRRNGPAPKSEERSAAPPASVHPVSTVLRPGSPATADSEVRIDLRLWDADEGRRIRVRAPQTISAASFERFLQAFRLLVRIEDGTATDS